MWNSVTITIIVCDSSNILIARLFLMARIVVLGLLCTCRHGFYKEINLWLLPFFEPNSVKFDLHAILGPHFVSITVHK